MKPELNVSTGLANYLIYAADPGPAFSAKKVAESEISFKSRLNQTFEEAEAELEAVLARNNFGLLDLFRAIAIR